MYQMDQMLVIENQKHFDSGTISLYDVNGKMVKMATLFEGQMKVTLNVQELVKGLYLLNITSGTKTNGYKVVLK